MTENTNKKLIIGLIIVGIVGLVGVLYRIFRATNDTTVPEEEIMLTTNNILDTTSSLPETCKKTMEAFNCLLSSPQLSGEAEGINLYYQQLIGQRNTIADDATLVSECNAQYKYITSLEATGYQDILASCQL